MTILFLALWLQMSAQQSWIVPKGECGQHADGSITDCCGAMMKFSLAHFLNQPTALDDMTRAEFAQAAQRAVDETDGKRVIFDNSEAEKAWRAEPIHRICHLRQLIDQGGGMETYVLDCIPEVLSNGRRQP